MNYFPALGEDTLCIILQMTGYRMAPSLARVCKQWQSLIRRYIIKMYTGRKLFSSYLINLHSSIPREKHLSHYTTHRKHHPQIKEIILRLPRRSPERIRSLLERCIFIRKEISPWNILTFIEAYLEIYPRGEFLSFYNKIELTSQKYYYSTRGYLIPSIKIIPKKAWPLISTNLPAILEIVGYNLHEKKRVIRFVKKLKSPFREIATYVLQACSKG